MNSTPPTWPARILIVEDEPMMADVLADALASAGYHVDKAANGRVALEKLRALPSFDLVLSDLLMPELDGVGLYRELEKLEPGLVQRIVFVSGITRISEYARFLDEVAAPVLRKPFGIETLLNAVAGFLKMSNPPGTAG